MTAMLFIYPTSSVRERIASFSLASPRAIILLYPAFIFFVLPSLIFNNLDMSTKPSRDTTIDSTIFWISITLLSGFTLIHIARRAEKIQCLKNLLYLIVPSIPTIFSFKILVGFTLAYSPMSWDLSTLHPDTLRAAVFGVFTNTMITLFLIYQENKIEQSKTGETVI